MVDETCFSRRKYNRGKEIRTEDSSIWYVTATEIFYSHDEKTPDGTPRYTTGRSKWMRCTRRTSDVLVPFVKKCALSSLSTVFTDKWKEYVGSSDYVRHLSVNHAVGFNDRITRVDTNGAESAHNCTKKRIKDSNGGRYGSARQLHHSRLHRC